MKQPAEEVIARWEDGLSSSEPIDPHALANAERLIRTLWLNGYSVVHENDEPTVTPESRESTQESRVPDACAEGGQNPPETTDGHTEADLAAWLRARADQLDGFDPSEFESSFTFGAVVGATSDLRAAATEIERLRRDVKWWCYRHPSPLPPPPPTMTTAEVLGDLREQIELGRLTQRAAQRSATPGSERDRLGGVADGLGTASYYVTEILRGLAS